MESFDVIIIGGGIAGLSTAWHLARAGVTKTCVLEREWACGTRASGTNAAIFRSFDDDAPGVTLALRTRVLLDELAADAPLLRETGAFYVGSVQRLAPGLAELERQHVRVVRNAPTPALTLRKDEEAVLVPGDGVLDPHAMIQALLQRLRAAGVTIRTGVEATLPLATTGRGAGVRGSPGTPQPISSRPFIVGDAQAPKLVLAGGAWNESLGEALGAPLGLVPLRRHLALLEAPALEAGSPVVWRLDDEVYFRPESGGALASPCDETEWPASGVVPTDAGALAKLGERLATLAPQLASAQVRRAWGCLRTFAPDREFVAGADPRVPGLWWCAGLGGRGMSCGLALGEVVAASVLGRVHPLAGVLAPRAHR